MRVIYIDQLGQGYIKGFGDFKKGVSGGRA